MFYLVSAAVVFTLPLLVTNCLCLHCCRFVSSRVVSFFGEVFCECSVWHHFIILGVLFVLMLQSCSRSLVSLFVVVMFSPVL